MSQEPKALIDLIKGVRGLTQPAEPDKDVRTIAEMYQDYLSSIDSVTITKTTIHRLSSIIEFSYGMNQFQLIVILKVGGPQGRWVEAKLESSIDLDYHDPNCCVTLGNLLKLLA